MSLDKTTLATWMILVGSLYLSGAGIYYTYHVFEDDQQLANMRTDAKLLELKKQKVKEEYLQERNIKIAAIDDTIKPENKEYFYKEMNTLDSIYRPQLASIARNIEQTNIQLDSLLLESKDMTPSPWYSWIAFFK